MVIVVIMIVVMVALLLPAERGVDVTSQVPCYRRAAGVEASELALEEREPLVVAVGLRQEISSPPEIVEDHTERGQRSARGEVHPLHRVLLDGVERPHVP